MERRFFNPSQPQTLQVAVFLLYANVVVALLFRTGSQGIFTALAATLTGSGRGQGSATLLGTLIAIFVVAGSAASAYLIANEKKIGWQLGVVVAIAPVAAIVLLVVLGEVSLAGAISISLLFDIALVALLFHNQTRAYEKLWFK